MTAIEITEKVLHHVRLNGPSKATQIANALGVDRAIVNGVLNGPLRGKVRQSRDYTWSLAEAPQTRPDASGSPKNSREPLFAYYLDCLSRDDDSGVRTLADSRSEVDYVELEAWPLEDGSSNVETEPLRKLIGRQRRDVRKKALWLGYPVRVRHVRGRRGSEGAYLEPLLIWPLDSDADELRFLPEPSVNTRALEGLAASENALVEATKLAGELGLEASESPPLDELAARLRDLRPEWDWREPLDPAKFRRFGDLRKITENGIYNAALVVMVDRSPFTVGLERELSDLRSVDDTAIAGSSLGTLLGTPGTRTAIEGPLVEPAPLNAEQRTAVRQALSEPLSVITGPPGTGKSQVVAAILVNAAWRGLSVLFASKNNQAVDVVLERVNALSPSPIMLRLGTRALQDELAHQITTILSARPTDDDRQAYELMRVKLRSVDEELRRLALQTQQSIELRNKVDRLERAAEGARRILSLASFEGADELSIADVEARVADLREALRRSKREAAPFFQRVFWTFLRDSRNRHLLNSVGNLDKVLARQSFERE
jgi:hypothetical protein